MKNKKMIILILTIPICTCLLYSQNDSRDIRIVKVKENDNVDEFKKKYNLDLNKKRIETFENKNNSMLKNSSSNDEITSSFNVKVESPNGDYCIAYFEGEVPSKYIGFYDKNGTIRNTFEINIEPQISYSKNGNYVVIFSLFQNQIYVFNKKGKLEFSSNYKEISSNNTLHNVFINNTGKQLLINTSYQLTLYDIDLHRKVWESNLDDIRRIRDCNFNQKDQFIIIKSLLKKEDRQEEDKYSLDIISAINGKDKAQIKGISEMYVIDKKVIVKSKNKWQEYEIK